ncbi:hypothetical protein ES703_46552 [subsurface metagenome]
MSKQIVVQQATYDKLQILNKKIGRNYSMNTLIDGLIKDWANNTNDNTYLESMQKDFCNKWLLEAKKENLIKTVNPELQTLFYLVLSGRLYAAQVYLTSFFSGVIRAQKQQKPEDYAAKKKVKK